MSPSLSAPDSIHQAMKLPRHGSVRQPATAPVAKDLRSSVELKLNSVLNELEYTPVIVEENIALWEAMRLYANRSGVPYDEGMNSGKMFKVGYNYPAICFPHHPVEVQAFIGIWTWLGLLLDDEAATYPDEFQLFHARFCAGENQPIPLLQAWADLMQKVFKYWDPIIANFIVTASINFLNANALQARSESSDLERARKIGDVIAVEGPVVVMRPGLVEELNGQLGDDEASGLCLFPWELTSVKEGGEVFGDLMGLEDDGDDVGSLSQLIMKGKEEIRGERSRYVGSWTSIGYCQELTEQSINGGYGMANHKAGQEMEDKILEGSVHTGT